MSIIYSFKRLIGFVFFSCLLFITSMSWANADGILIPFYIYPTSTAIQPLLNAKTNHPNVPMRVILDPANGPGSTQDPVYVAAITALRQAGIQIVGYVYTNYNARPIANVEADIATWQNLYQPDGIFLDSMGTLTSYYSSLTQYIKNLGMQFSIGNAGSNVSTAYAAVVDTVVIYTNASLPNLSTYSNWKSSGYPKTSMAMLAYNVTQFSPTFIFEAKQFVGWLYITDIGGMNPWGSLPTYFNLLMSALDTSNVGTIFPFYIYPTSTAIQPLIDTAMNYPNVPIWVVLDPANGPGTSQDPVYVQAIAQLKAVGIGILGYVDTEYTQRSQTLVKNDITKWLSFYEIDGIFLDLMSVNHTYYSSITTYAHNKGLPVVVGNPGTNINSSSGADVDITNIFENNYLPSPLSQFQNWYSIYPPSKLSLIAYNTPTLPTSFITQAAPFFGWIFITDNTNGYYNTYPSYFDSFVQTLSTL